MGGRIRSPQGCKLELGDEEGTDEVRFVFAEQSFGEIGDEDAGVIHDKADVDSAAHLAEDVADGGSHDQLTDLVLDRGNDFGQESAVIAGEFTQPEGPDHGVIDLLDHPLAVHRVGEHPLDRQKRDVVALLEGGKGSVQDVFHPRSPGIPPDTFQGTDDRGGNQVRWGAEGALEDVEADGVVVVGRVEVHDMVGAGGWDAIKDVTGEVSMRVNQPDTMAFLNILHDEITDEGGFAGAGLADDVHMLTADSGGEAEGLLDAAPPLSLTDVCKVLVPHPTKPPLRKENNGPRGRVDVCCASGGACVPRCRPTYALVDEPGG